MNHEDIWLNRSASPWGQWALLTGNASLSSCPSLQSPFRSGLHPWSPLLGHREYEIWKKALQATRIACKEACRVLNLLFKAMKDILQALFLLLLLINMKYSQARASCSCLQHYSTAAWPAPEALYKSVCKGRRCLAWFKSPCRAMKWTHTAPNSPFHRTVNVRKQNKESVFL